MSNYNHSDEKIEVIDPSDDRYKSCLLYTSDAADE